MEIQTNFTTFHENKTGISKIETSKSQVYIDIMEQFILIKTSENSTLYTPIQTIEFNGARSSCINRENTLMFSKLNMLFDEMTNLLENECNRPKNLIKNFQFQEVVKDKNSLNGDFNNVNKSQTYSFNKFGDISLVKHTILTTRVTKESSTLISIYEGLYNFPKSAEKTKKIAFKVKPANPCQKPVF